MKRLEIFSIPFFELKVDLDRILIPESKFEPSWESGVPTTHLTQKPIPRSTLEYLTEVVSKPLDTIKDKFLAMRFTQIWRNKYDEHTYQGYHIHPNAQWSFIIYEDVTSKTAFIHPIMPLIQNHFGDNSKVFPMDYRPNLEPGSMILFPSFLGHEVLPGNTGTTLSGNIVVEY
mgnify:CR=1 FL=1